MGRRMRTRNLRGLPRRHRPKPGRRHKRLIWSLIASRQHQKSRHSAITDSACDVHNVHAHSSLLLPFSLPSAPTSCRSNTWHSRCGSQYPLHHHPSSQYLIPAPQDPSKTSANVYSSQNHLLSFLCLLLSYNRHQVADQLTAHAHYHAHTPIHLRSQ